MNELTQKGINALKAGDRATARRLLAAAVKQDPNDAQAWLWLTGALDKDDERIACLRQVLRIDPTNPAAARGLAQILERRAPAKVEPAPEPPVEQPAPPQPTAQRVETPAPAQEISPLDALRAEAVQPPETLAPERQTSQPAAPARPAPARAVQTPAQPQRRAAKPAPAGPARLIFRTRPSLVPALACFWLFLFGSIFIASMLSETPDLGLMLAAVIGVLLELVVIYAALRIFAVRYELTNQQLTLRFRGKRVQVDIPDIYNVECKQSLAQKLIGTGDVNLDLAVNGELAHLRMRNIPNCKRRTDQLLYLVKEQA